ncbi:MAG: hypothetical protein ACI92O_000340 [Colwellia sp.]|jgi:hypothetical protein
MAIYKIFQTTTNISQITAHILEMRDGAFFITNKRQCRFKNFTLIKMDNDQALFLEFIDEVNSNVKREMFARHKLKTNGLLA